LLSNDLLSAFSTNRFEHDPVPDDLAEPLMHSQEFLEITGIRSLSDADEQPWNDTSHLTPQELENPDLHRLQRHIGVSRAVARFRPEKRRIRATLTRF
jgi:hypothetical protein